MSERKYLTELGPLTPTSRNRKKYNGEDGVVQEGIHCTVTLSPLNLWARWYCQWKACGRALATGKKDCWGGRVPLIARSGIYSGWIFGEGESHGNQKEGQVVFVPLRWGFWESHQGSQSLGENAIVGGLMCKCFSAEKNTVPAAKCNSWDLAGGLQQQLDSWYVTYILMINNIHLYITYI